MCEKVVTKAEKGQIDQKSQRHLHQSWVQISVNYTPLVSVSLRHVGEPQKSIFS